MILPVKFIKNLSQFRLVTFDIVDTILESRLTPAQQYAATAEKEFDVSDIDIKLLAECLHKESKRMKAKYPNYGRDKANIGWENWWIAVLEKTFHCAHVQIDDVKLKYLTKRLVEVYRTSECWSHISGGRALLDKIRFAGKYVGVISNFDASLPQILSEMGIKKKFDFVVTSYEAGFEKPHAKIFKMAQQRCKVPPKHCLHIGNLSKIDYDGARKAGWSALLVSKFADPSVVYNETHVYPDLEQLLYALECKDIIWKDKKSNPCKKELVFQW